MKFYKENKKQSFINGIAYAVCGVFALFLLCVVLLVDPPFTGTADVYEGTIVSSDGVALTEIADRDNPNPTVAHAASIVYPGEYSALLGYNSQKYKLSGLRSTYTTYLYTGKREQSGKTLELTLNHSLQSFAYSTMKAFDRDSSVVVMDNETGAVRALVSTKKGFEYNANNIDETYEAYNKIDGFFIPEWRMARAPGSTFKIVSATGMVSAGQGGYTYNDSGYIILSNGKRINNAEGYAYGSIGLDKALEKSSNVYFVSAYTEGAVSPEELKKTATAYKLGQSFELDFTTISSNFELDTASPFEVAQTAFGQGKTLVTPIHQAMIMSSVIKGGRMVKPYLVSSDTEEKSFWQVLFGKDEKGTEYIDEAAIDEAVANTVKTALGKTAVSYGFPEGSYAKTGTAETKQGVQLWVVCGNENYTVVVSMSNNSGYSKVILSAAKDILSYTGQIKGAQDE